MQRLEVPQWRRAATPIALAFVSLLAAIVLWVAVTDAENPNKVDPFRGGIEVKAVNLPEGLSVGSIRESTVSVRISASEDTFKKLTTADFQAQVDLSGERRTTSDQVVLVTVVGRKDVQIVEVSPAFVTVTMEQTTTKLVPVQVNRVGALPQGFSVGNVEANPGVARITGAGSLVNLVGTADADVNLTGLRASLHQQYPLTVRDPRGADIRGVSVDPASADVRVVINQQEVTLALTIVPQFTGNVVDGFNLVSAIPDPQALAVSGPLEVLNALGSLQTEPIDLTGLRADATRSVRLRLPQGITLPRDAINVRLKVAPAVGEYTIAVAPQVTNLAENLKASLQTPTINVRVRGELPTLRGLAPGSLRATVNAAGLDEGVHVLNVTLVAPEGVTVASTDPTQVVLVLRR